MSQSKLVHFILGHWPVKPLIVLSKHLRLPGFEGLPLYDVGDFFIKRLNEGELQTRARAIAFSFFLALFPTIIFIFTLIPYIPIQSFPEKLLQLIQDFLPANTFEAARETIEDIILHQRGGLLSFGFIFAIFVSADGILALMTWFNRSYHGKEERSAWRQRIMAIGLTLTLACFVFLAIGLIAANEIIFYYLEEKQILVNFMQLLLLSIGKWIILLSLCFSAISLLYYFGPSKHEKLRFISAGSSLATLLIVLTTLGFNYFITNFGQYNKVYGSIGTLIVILIWIYINSFVLLVGYELNVSIRKARKITSLPIA
ncbi:MAG: YihY/virulence factor BrkB family protein [Bacteroidia bacterium]|nr:YihY/virulence factor BrkB family protein [Bacteroidia bacterium]